MPLRLSVLTLISATAFGGCIWRSDAQCEIARGRIVAADEQKGVPCTIHLLIQRENAENPEIPTSPGSAQTGDNFAYRRFLPSARLKASIVCEGYSPYLSDTFSWQKGPYCGAPFDLGTVTVKPEGARPVP